MAELQASLEALTLPLEGLVERYIQGPPGLKGETPQCDRSDRYCLGTVSRGTSIYRMTSFPIFYLHFWNLGTPPASSACRFIMSQRFTIPGLWSSLAMQSSTLLRHTVKYRGMAMCARYTHLLAYAPAVPGGCTENYQSFLAPLDMYGRIHKVHPIMLPGGGKYQGSLTGLAVSRELGTVWACGIAPGGYHYSLLTFKLSDMDVSFNAAESKWGEKEIIACSVQELSSHDHKQKKCTLHWDKKTQWLWIGNDAIKGQTGAARAFSPQTTVCAEGGSAHTIRTNVVIKSMEYGQHVASFSFLSDVLSDDYLALSRCDLYDRAAKTLPCKLEFYGVDRRRNEAQSIASKSPTLTIRTPAGMGNLNHDTSLGVKPVEGGFFHGSFVGMTSEHADETEIGGGEPEDRIFVFRTPYLKTGIRKTVDRISLRVAGATIVPPMPLLAFLPTNPGDSLDVERRRLQEESSVVAGEGGGAMTATSRARRIVGHHSTERRRLDLLAAFIQSVGEANVRGEQQPSVITEGRGLSTVPAECNARQIYKAPDNPDDFAFKGCLGGPFYLINNRVGSGASLGFKFSVGIGPISIGGGFWFTPTLVVGVIANLCPDKWKVRLGLDVQTGVNARLDISAGIDNLCKGWLRMDGEALKLILQPSMTVDMKRGKVGGRFDLGITAISIGIKAGVTYPTIKFCKSCGGCCGCCCIHYPCGWGWGSESSYEFDRISVGGGPVRNILASLGDDDDSTPPRIGLVSITQIGPRHVKANFASFIEDESDIRSTQLTIRNTNRDGHIFFCKAFDGAAEGWSGELSEAPGHEDRVVACVMVTNSYDKASAKCSDYILFDAEAPKILSLATTNPFTGRWRMATFACDLYEEFAALGEITEDDCRMYTNETETIRFAIKLQDLYTGKSQPVKSGAHVQPAHQKIMYTTLPTLTFAHSCVALRTQLCGP